jgi:hypothetical protein
MGVAYRFPSVGISRGLYAAAGGCRRNQVGSSDWDDSVLFSVRINGNMI